MRELIVCETEVAETSLGYDSPTTITISMDHSLSSPAICTSQGR